MRNVPGFRSAGHILNFYTCINNVCNCFNLLYIHLYSRLQKSCNKQAEQWKTTTDLLCLNREEGHAEAGKIIMVNQLWFSTVSACLLQDFNKRRGLFQEMFLNSPHLRLQILFHQLPPFYSCSCSSFSSWSSSLTSSQTLGSPEKCCYCKQIISESCSWCPSQHLHVSQDPC